MRLSISRESYENALEEIKQMEQEKAVDRGWPDELFELVTNAIGDPYDRSPGRLSFEDIAAYLRKKGWWQGSGSALSQAYRKEKARRAA